MLDLTASITLLPDHHAYRVKGDGLMHYQVRFGTELLHAAGLPLHKRLPAASGAAVTAAVPFFSPAIAAKEAAEIAAINAAEDA